jgi:hypothetical protein
MQWQITLSNYCPELFAGSICVTLKDFRIVWIGQDHFFCYSSLYVIKCFLMNLVSLVVYLLACFALVTLV